MIVSLSATKNDVCHGHIQYNSGGRRARLRHRCAQQLVTTVALRDILAGNYVAPAALDAVAGLRPLMDDAIARYGTQNPLVSHLAFLARVLDVARD